jgi:chromate transporter
LSDIIDGKKPIIPRWDLYSGFVLVGLFGFGGIGAAIYHVIVERRRWLSPEEYTRLLGLGQVLPGASLINITAILGDRNHGLTGALLALGGLLTFPLFILVAIASAYDAFSYLPDVQAATKAAAAAAVGLMFGTGMKLGKVILKSPVSMVIALSSFVAIGIFRLPLALSILALCPLAVALVYWRSRP